MTDPKDDLLAEAERLLMAVDFERQYSSLGLVYADWLSRYEAHRKATVVVDAQREPNRGRAYEWVRDVLGCLDEVLPCAFADEVAKRTAMPCADCDIQIRAVHRLILEAEARGAERERSACEAIARAVVEEHLRGLKSETNRDHIKAMPGMPAGTAQRIADAIAAREGSGKP